MPTYSPSSCCPPLNYFERKIPLIFVRHSARFKDLIVRFVCVPFLASSQRAEQLLQPIRYGLLLKRLEIVTQGLRDSAAHPGRSLHLILGLSIMARVARENGTWRGATWPLGNREQKTATDFRASAF